MRDEFQGRTWDWLRLSSLTPTQIVIGKLFGAAAMWWIAICINAVIYMISSQGLNNPPNLILQGSVYLGLLIAAAGCSTIVISLMKRGSFILAVILIGSVSSPISLLMRKNEYPGVWWGWIIDQGTFGAIWCPLFGLLSIWLAIRLIRRKMLIESFPVELPILISIAFIFSAGFFLPMQSFNLTTFAGAQYLYWLALGMGFLSVIIVQPSRTHTARLFGRYENKQWRRFFADLPNWCVVIVAACISLLVCSIFYSEQANISNLVSQPSVLLFDLGALCFCLRDIAALHWRAFRLDAERRDIFMVVAYMALAYGLLPMFAHLLFGAEELFLPSGTTVETQLLSVASLGIQFIIVSYLAVLAWRKRT